MINEIGVAMTEKNAKNNKRKWKPVMLDDPSFFAEDVEGFVSLEVLEEYNLEEVRGGSDGGPTRKKKAKKGFQEV